MPEHSKSFRLSRHAVALAGAGLLALGGAAGAVVIAETRPSASMVPAAPTAIRALTSGVVTVRGRVGEVYGNKFTLDDGTGRALVDTGPEGDNRTLVAAGQSVLVQGRFKRGFIHAAFLVGPDRKVLALEPLAGPPHGPDHGPGAPSPGDGKVPPPAPGESPAPAPARAG